MSSATSTTDSTEEPNHRLHWLPRFDRRVTVCTGERHTDHSAEEPCPPARRPSATRLSLSRSLGPWPLLASPGSTWPLVGFFQGKLRTRPPRGRLKPRPVSGAFSPSSGNPCPRDFTPSEHPPSNLLILTLALSPFHLRGPNPLAHTGHPLCLYDSHPAKIPKRIPASVRQDAP